MWEQQQFLYNSSTKTSWDQELFYSEMYPPNMTVSWLDTDIPKSAVYEKDIEYTFNEYGFRSDSFTNRSEINILTCGCSQTVGIGVNYHEAWPFVLKHLVNRYTDKSVTVWNLATSGASPDYVVRSIHKTSSILKPDFVCVFWPPITRIEVPYMHNNSKVTQSFIRNKDFPKEFVDEAWLQDYLYQKNLILAKSICEVNKTKFISNVVTESIVENIEGDYFPADSEARDGLHPGPNWHRSGAEYYFNFIKENI